MSAAAGYNENEKKHNEFLAATFNNNNNTGTAAGGAGAGAAAAAAAAAVAAQGFTASHRNMPPAAPAGAAGGAGAAAQDLFARMPPARTSSILSFPKVPTGEPGIYTSKRKFLKELDEYFHNKLKEFNEDFKIFMYLFIKNLINDKLRIRTKVPKKLLENLILIINNINKISEIELIDLLLDVIHESIQNGEIIFSTKDERNRYFTSVADKITELYIRQHKLTTTGGKRTIKKRKGKKQTRKTRRSTYRSS